MSLNNTKYDSVTLSAGTSTGIQQENVSFTPLLDSINLLTQGVKSKIAMVRSKRSAMSIADMFDLQMMMNKLSQMSELSTSMLTAFNTSILSMSRNLKG